MGRVDRSFDCAHQLGLGHGQSGGAQELVGQALVARQVHGDGARARGHRRPDALLVDALAELDEAASVESDVGDVSRERLIDERRG